MAGSIFMTKEKCGSGALTMYNVARWQSIEGSRHLSLSHLNWDAPQLWVSFEMGLSSITEHGYLLWQCHVWLKKQKQKKSGKIHVCLDFLPNTSIVDQDKWTATGHLKGIYFLWKKIKYGKKKAYLSYIQNESMMNRAFESIAET